MSGLHEEAADSFSRQGLMTHFGAKLVEAADGRCVIEVGSADHLTQQDGMFHGGVMAAIADAACGHAAFTLAPAAANILTIEFKINFLAPADGDRLRASATVLKQGRSVSTVEARVETMRGAEWAHCGEMLATMFVRQPRGGG